MAATEVVSYAMMVLIAIVFLVFSISRLLETTHKIRIDWLIPILEGFDAIAWFVLIPLHLGFVGTESIFLSAPAIMYFALGIVFVLLTIKSAIDNLQAAVLSGQSVETV